MQIATHVLEEIAFLKDMQTVLLTGCDATRCTAQVFKRTDGTGCTRYAFQP
jgi:hypothetical protein